MRVLLLDSNFEVLISSLERLETFHLLEMKARICLQSISCHQDLCGCRQQSMAAAKLGAWVNGAVGTLTQGDSVGTQVPAGPLIPCRPVSCHLLSPSILCWIIKHRRFNSGAGGAVLAAAWWSPQASLCASCPQPQPLAGRRVAQLAALAFLSFLQSPASSRVGNALAPDFNQHCAAS